MSKKGAKSDSKEQQLSVFDLLRQVQAEKKETRSDAGTMDCSAKLRDALSAAIKGCPLGIHQIAGEMSHLVGRTITAEMIYSWTRRSDEMNGRAPRYIPAEYLPAFCRVTGADAPLLIMVELTGSFMVPGAEALRAEIQRLDEQRRGLGDQIRRRRVLLEEFGG
jgi:hypothetical protein